MEHADEAVRERGQARLRPTSPWPFVAWLALLVVQLVSPDRVWSWLLVGLGLLILIAYVWARQMRDNVHASRRVHGAWVVAGDRLAEQFTIVNRARLPVLWARVRDGSDVPGYRVDRVETVAAEGERSWSTAGVCQRRGVFRLGPWDLEMGDPLGFFSVTHHYPDVSTIMVYPRASHLPDLDLPRGSGGRPRQLVRARRGGDDPRRRAAGVRAGRPAAAHPLESRPRGTTSFWCASSTGSRRAICG